MKIKDERFIAKKGDFKIVNKNKKNTDKTKPVKNSKKG